MTITERRPFSYKNDAAVPAFDDRFDIVFMDAECALCSTSARQIARLDRKKRFRICPIQSPLGGAILQHYGVDSKDPSTWIFLSSGVAFTSLDAVVKAGKRLGGIGHLVRPLGLLPLIVQNWLYEKLARNRYRIFGKADLCALPDPEVQKRLIQ